MTDAFDASGAADAVLVKVTQDGRKVEVVDGWVCLAAHARQTTSSLCSNTQTGRSSRKRCRGPRMWPAGYR
jgi:hypothetical protein